jgi:hypothetical protein
MAKREPLEMVAPVMEVGRLELFDRDGNLVYEAGDFVPGRTLIPVGWSMAAGATRIVGRSGAVIRKWDPWGVLALADGRSPTLVAGA